MALTEKLTAIADAIRRKTGKTEGLTLEQMESEISGIQTGGGEVSAKQLTAMRIMSRLETGALNLDDLGVTQLEDYFAYENHHITSLYWSASPAPVGGIRGDVFSGCTALETVDFPNVTYWHYPRVFKGCTSLKNVNIPKYDDAIQQQSFYGCTSLELIDLANATKINSMSLSNCTVLKTIILRSTTVCEIGNANVLNNTPFAEGGTGGTVYVPQALIPEYRQATNWSTLYAAGTCNFVAIEGSEYE
jgi:hypothetical protein